MGRYRKSTDSYEDNCFHCCEAYSLLVVRKRSRRVWEDGASRVYNYTFV